MYSVRAYLMIGLSSSPAIEQLQFLSLFERTCSDVHDTDVKLTVCSRTGKQEVVAALLTFEDWMG